AQVCAASETHAEDGHAALTRRGASDQGGGQTAVFLRQLEVTDSGHSSFLIAPTASAFRRWRLDATKRVPGSLPLRPRSEAPRPSGGRRPVAPDATTTRTIHIGRRKQRKSDATEAWSGACF